MYTHTQGAVTYNSLLPVKINENFDHKDMGCCEGFEVCDRGIVNNGYVSR